MINVIATLTVRPGQGEALEQAMASARARTLENPECLRYDLQRVRRSETEYVMLEAWSSPEALRAHGASEAFAELGATLATVVAGQPVITVLEPVGGQVALSAS